MKLFLNLFVACILCTFNAFTQTKPLGNQLEVNLCKGSISEFRNFCKSTSLELSVNALLLIDFGGKNITKRLNSSNSKFTIVPDRDNVYDCSFKVYSAQIDETSSFSYSYYYLSNKLLYNFEGEDYVFSTIDGSCDTCIKGLKISTIKKNTGEVLVIEFETDIYLFSKKGNTIIIRQGSYCIFVI